MDSERRRNEDPVRQELISTLSSVQTALEIYKGIQEDLKLTIEEHEEILRGTNEKSGYEERLRDVEKFCRRLDIVITGDGGNYGHSISGKLEQIKKDISDTDSAVLDLKITIKDIIEEKKKSLDKRNQNITILIAVLSLIGTLIGTSLTIMGPKLIDVITSKQSHPLTQPLQKKRKRIPPPKMDVALPSEAL